MKKWMVTIGACLLIALALFWFKKSKIETAMALYASQPEHSETVDISQVKEVSRTDTIKAMGEAISPQQVVLRNELSGYITAVNFQSGAVVKKDDVIIQLDVSEESARLESAKARLKLAQTIYDREKVLRQSNAVSQEALDRAAAELSVFKADVSALESVIRKKTVVAPYDGTIGVHQFEVGQYLANDTFVTMLLGESTFMWLDFSVPQFYGELNTGDTVRARLVRDQKTVSSRYVEASIVAANTNISQSARSRLYRAKIDTAQLKVLPGASVEVVVPVGQSKKMLVLPVQSILNDFQGQYVYALDTKDGAKGYRARRVSVNLHSQEGDVAFFESTLKVGDVVAAAGSFKLIPGVLVFGKEKKDKGE